jgi:hypothetical protein
MFLFGCRYRERSVVINTFKVDDRHFRKHHQAISQAGVVETPVCELSTLGNHDQAFTVPDWKLLFQPPPALPCGTFFLHLSSPEG